MLTGQRIGLAGRTGNLGEIPHRPGHVHLNIHARTQFIVGLRVDLVSAGLDNFNIRTIPNNDYSLLFLCQCQITSDYANPNNCNFASNSVTISCWAVDELKCPFIDNTTQRIRKVSAQLKYLEYYNGNVTNNLGNENSELSQSLIAYKNSAENISFFTQVNDLNNEVTDNLINYLNSHI